ncbi:Pvc16 family protein [Sphingomonas bacterium]|uniref:Pvc16 family protein n=1 Tax=Sphingomonas bacterium TaxID=1895847 RepID=UPI00262FE278|nr:Pvc16 family protein [Sphingomonas bacterium]MDB5678517.1 hypothetical protein [Sphingomonas bacterium]
MAIDTVTNAIIDMFRESLGNQEGIPPGAYVISLASPDEGAANADLVLFLYLVTPAPELRNAERIRPWPGPSDPPVLLDLAVPLELHFLLTVGQGAPAGAAGLGRLADAVRAIEAASPMAVPAAFQEAVWLSLLPLSSDEMARIWGLFPNENCRSSIAFRASPVWIDPRSPQIAAAPVTDGATRAGRMPEAA